MARTTAKVWDVLCAHPGREIGLNEIAQATKLTRKQVRDAMWVITARLGHDVRRVSPDVFMLPPDAVRELGTQSGAHGGSPSSAMFERVATTQSGSVILRDGAGRMYEAKEIPQ